MLPSPIASCRPASRHRRRGSAGGLATLVLPAVVLAATVLGTAACGPAPTPSPSAQATPPSATGTPAASVDAAATYAAIASQVEQIRGLTPKAAIAPDLIDETQLRANLTADFDQNNPPAAVQFTEDLYVELGVLPAGTSLRDAYLGLQAGQVAGYYSPAQKQLFVVSRSGGIGATQRVTYAHEFTHELQDQNFDLAKLGLATTDQSDRSLARLGLVEGDAVSTQAAWMTANLTASDLAEVLRDASDPVAIAALARAPMILRATTLFPYTDGLNFVTSLKGQGGEAAVNAAFARPPASTAQVIHPELYATDVAPVGVTLPGDLAQRLGGGWRLLGEDTLGELGIRAWLSSDGLEPATAATAAAGWAGDRIAVLAGPNDQIALVIVARWTSSADLGEFAAAYASVSSHLAGVPAYDATLDNDTAAIIVAPTNALGQALRADLHR